MVGLREEAGHEAPADAAVAASDEDEGLRHFKTMGLQSRGL